MKSFICLALIIVCIAVANQAAVIQPELVSLNQPNYFDNEIVDFKTEHSRQRRQNNQASIGVENQRHGGTNVNAQVGRVWESNNGKTRVEANANWSKQFGHGGGKPNYGANIQFQHRF